MARGAKPRLGGAPASGGAAPAVRAASTAHRQGSLSAAARTLASGAARNTSDSPTSFAARAPANASTGDAHRPCACGGSCPRCSGGGADSRAAAARAPPTQISSQPRARTNHALEQDADRAAERVRSAPASAAAPAPERANPTPRAPGLNGGQPLPAATQRVLAPRFGVDLSHVRVHANDSAAAHARAQRADAYTYGADIVFGQDKYAPGTAGGDQLLAHEVAHVVQQTAPSNVAAGGPVRARAATPAIARSPDQWLRGTVDVRAFSFTELVDEIDELTQWLDRQMESTDDTQLIEQAIETLRAEVTRRNRAAAPPPSRTARDRRRRRGRADTAAEPLAADAAPDRYPRAMLEMTSVHYEDPAEMRAEYDLIMRWLVRPEISAEQRQILEGERASLEPQLHVDREHVVRERHAARVREALTPADPSLATAIVDVARTITGISGEPGNPNIFYIYDHGERVAISREQAEGLRSGLLRELSSAGRGIESRASYYWDRYHDQVRINEEYFVSSTISGWLADVEDPRAELTNRYMRLQARLDVMRDHLDAGRLVEFATLLPSAESLGQEIRVLARAFYEGYIEGAEIAIARLEFTRNAAFAITGAIAAVVAAPFVAGAVAGLGATGAVGTGLTMLGTGTVVGGGMAVVRGGSSALGTGLAGGSMGEVVEAGLTEGETGLREGFIAGAGGAAGRSLGLALEGAAAGTAMVGRIAGEMAINGMAAAADVLLRPRPPAPERTREELIQEAALAAAIAAATAIPGAALGGSSSPVVRQFVAPFVAGCTTYLGMRASGATHADALRQAAVAVASSAAMSRASGGNELDAAMEARGRGVGESMRDSAVSGMRTVRSSAAAVMVGTADALPPLRSGFGSTPADIAMTETMPSVSAPAARVAPDVEVAPPARAPAPEVEAAPTTAAAHVDEAAPAAVAPHVDEAAPLPAAAPEIETAVPPAPHVEADAAPETAPAPTSTVDADDAALDAAFAGHAEVSEITAMGRSAGTGRSRVFASLDRVALTAAQRAAAIRLHGQRMGSRLAAAWTRRGSARETTELATIRGHVAAGRMDEARTLARAAFDRHRDRFWAEVRRDPSLQQAFTDAGMEFVGASGAPVYRDPATGELLDRMTLEHSTRLADDPTTALDAANLQTVLGDENSVQLEFIRREDRFQ